VNGTGGACESDGPLVSAVTVALDDYLRRDGSKATAQAVEKASRIYSRLREYRGVVKMTQAENVLLQNALDMLRARLRFFGESV
jgi:hypothetical protein